MRAEQARKRAARRAGFVANPNMRSAMSVRVPGGAAKRFFGPATPGPKRNRRMAAYQNFGWLNAFILSKLNVAKRIKADPRLARALGIGDKKVRLDFVWKSLWTPSTAAYRLAKRADEIEEERRAQERRNSRSAIQRGIQQVRDYFKGRK
jgi:hypothetical protein